MFYNGILFLLTAVRGMLSVMHSRGGSMLLFQIIIVISVLVTVMSTPEDCKNVANRLRITESILGKFEIQDGKLRS